MNEERLVKYGELLLIRCELLLDKMKDTDRTIYVDMCTRMTEYDLEKTGDLEILVEDIEEMEKDLSTLYKEFVGYKNK